MSQPALLERALAATAATATDPTAARILDAALTEFVEFGLRRTTVEHVARRAGVGRMTVYRRFGRKEALVEAVMSRQLARFLVELEAAVQSAASAEEGLVEGFVFGVTRAREDPLYRRLLETDPEALLPYLTINGGPLVGAATEFVSASVREAAPAFDARPVAEALIRLAHSMLLAPQASLPFGDDDALREFALKLVAASR